MVGGEKRGGEWKKMNWFSFLPFIINQINKNKNKNKKKKKKKKKTNQHKSPSTKAPHS